MKIARAITVLLAVLCIATLFPFLREGFGGFLFWLQSWAWIFASWTFCCYCWQILRRR